MLQEDPATIYDWAEDVNMVFNADKFECLGYWPGRTKKTSPIEEKLNLRDLGVEIRYDFSFIIHIEITLTLASRLVD